MLKVEVFDGRFHDLLDVNQDIKMLGALGGFFEGPIWNAKTKDLTFNSLTNQKTWRWSEKGGLRLMRENTNIANGMCYDSAGRIVICEQIGFRISRMNYELTEYQVLATEYEGKPLNSPNDIVCHSSGMLYFTDPHFGRRPSRHGRFGSMPQPCQGIYMLTPETLQLTRATGELDNPNGLCFSPDEKKMYFAESTLSQVTVMDVLSDGTLRNRQVFARTAKKGEGMPDGIKCDVAGNIWVTAEGGVQIIHSDGTLLGVLFTPEVCGNACFGGNDLQTFFMGSEFEFCAVRTKIKGQPLRR